MSRIRPVSSRTRDSGSDERAQALVEFALIAPVLILIVVGMIEFARAWQVYQVLTDGAREGVRNAVVNDGLDSLQVESIIKRYLYFGGRIDTTTPRLQITWPNDYTHSVGEPVIVRIEYIHSWTWLRPLMGWLPTQEEGAVTLKTEIAMRKE